MVIFQPYKLMCTRDGMSATKSMIKLLISKTREVRILYLSFFAIN